MANDNKDSILVAGAKQMSMFDTRLYRTLATVDTSAEKAYYQTYYPMFDYGSYVGDFHETVGAIDQSKLEAEQLQGASADEIKKQKEKLDEQAGYIKDFNKKYEDQYLATRSLIHPYALVNLAGTSGHKGNISMMLMYDKFNKRKFYEIDGARGYSGHYSKSPTTTSLIKWGNESLKGKTPYSFQDFVFCKWWNKIENNRLVTLRRYAVPVTDNIEFKDYDVSEKADENDNLTGSPGKNPWVPLATAVTYFGKETGNELSKMLAFSAQYNWTDLKNPDMMDVSSKQNDAGEGLLGGFSGIQSGLGVIARTMSVLGDIQNGKTLNLDSVKGVPPDPYSNGPYANRILGPINVITTVKKRERGLTFKQDGLKLTFEYIARPISGINNKAVLLDILSNILVLCYSSGSFYGGMHRYNVSGNPALYPWKYGDAMNRLHKGQIFGKDGAVQSLTHHVFNDSKSLIASFLPDIGNMIKGVFDAALKGVQGIFGNKEAAESSEKSLNDALGTNTAKTIQKLVAAKALRGSSVPYLSGNRALLTGEPVGDWHLTIGNPFNPIAMIGNLIVKDLAIEFYDELGPDDFPIGFKAIITLEHGMGRDRDAIESMFNRGFGRIYTLPTEFRSSADGETKVDKFTGTNGKERKGYEEIRQTYYGGGTRGIMDMYTSELSNKGSIYNGDVGKMKSLAGLTHNKFTIASYFINPWQMGMNM